MAWYLVMVIVIPGLVGTALNLDQAGVHTIQLVVLLTYIAEYPNSFFFGIPAWALRGVLAAEILQLTGDRAGRHLLFFLVSLLVGALAGRGVEMLEAFPWIPKIRCTASAPAAEAKPPAGRGDRAVRRTQLGVRRIQSELDDLLDKISAKGMDSLSKSEAAPQRTQQAPSRQRRASYQRAKEATSAAGVDGGDVFGASLGDHEGPPPLPPSGPRSISQSAVLMTSRLCSMINTVLPWSTSRDSTVDSRPHHRSGGRSSR